MASEMALIVIIIIINVVTLLIGLAATTYDLGGYIEPLSPSTVFNTAARASRSTLQLVLTIMLGIVTLTNVICGLLSVKLKNLTLITTVMSIVTMDFMLRTCLFVLILFSCVKGPATTAEAMKNVFPTYGDAEVARSKDFTVALDKFSTDNKCCGWGMQPTENSYLGTAWYRKKNADKKGVVLTLPEPCCVSREPNILTRCTNVTSLVIARREATIHQENCLVLLMQPIRITMYILLGAHAAVIILDAMTAYTSMAITRAITGVEVSHDSPSSEWDEMEEKPVLPPLKQTKAAK